MSDQSNNQSDQAMAQPIDESGYETDDSMDSIESVEDTLKHPGQEADESDEQSDDEKNDEQDNEADEQAGELPDDRAEYMKSIEAVLRAEPSEGLSKDQSTAQLNHAFVDWQKYGAFRKRKLLIPLEHDHSSINQSNNQPDKLSLKLNDLKGSDATFANRLVEALKSNQSNPSVMAYFCTMSRCFEADLQADTATIDMSTKISNIQPIDQAANRSVNQSVFDQHLADCSLRGYDHEMLHRSIDFDWMMEDTDEQGDDDEGNDELNEESEETGKIKLLYHRHAILMLPVKRKWVWVSQSTDESTEASSQKSADQVFDLFDKVCDQSINQCRSNTQSMNDCLLDLISFARLIKIKQAVNGSINVNYKFLRRLMDMDDLIDQSHKSSSSQSRKQIRKMVAETFSLLAGALESIQQPVDDSIKQSITSLQSLDQSIKQPATELTKSLIESITQSASQSTDSERSEAIKDELQSFVAKLTNIIGQKRAREE